jgi:hypothetical protein
MKTVSGPRWGCLYPVYICWDAIIRATNTCLTPDDDMSCPKVSLYDVSMCSPHSPRHLPSHTLSRPLVKVAGLTPRFHAPHGPCPSALRRRLNGAHPSGWASGLRPLPSCWPFGGSSRSLGRPQPRGGWLALPAALDLLCGLHFRSAFAVFFFFSPTHPPLYIILPPSSP